MCPELADRLVSAPTTQYLRGLRCLPTAIGEFLSYQETNSGLLQVD